MKVKISKNNIDKHKGWRAYWWDGYKSKDESVCIMEFDPGMTFKHIHLNPKEDEIEVVLEGKVVYSGDVSGNFGPGDVIRQRGKGKQIDIHNPGPGKLKLLVINRPPWRESDEVIFTDK